MGRERSLNGCSTEFKDNVGLENGCPQAELTAIRVPVLSRFFYKHKIEGKSWDRDKMAIIKGWPLYWDGRYVGFHRTCACNKY